MLAQELGPCLTWSYGRFHTKRPPGLARKIYERRYGKQPHHIVIRHKCDNNLCVNIDHLEPGTFKDNARDYHTRKCRCKRHGARKYKVTTTEIPPRLSGKEIVEIKSLVTRIMANRENQNHG